jgi:hypothetical protein
VPAPAIALAGATLSRATRRLVAIAAGTVALWLFVLIGVLGAILGIEPTQNAGYDPAALAAGEIPPQYLELYGVDGNHDGHNPSMTRPTRSPPPPPTSVPPGRSPTTTARSSLTTTPTHTSPKSSPEPHLPAPPAPNQRARRSTRPASATCCPTRASLSLPASAPTCRPAASTCASWRRSAGSALASA